MRLVKTSAVPLSGTGHLLPHAVIPALAFHGFGGSAAGTDAAIMIGILSYGFHILLMVYEPVRRDGDLMQSFALSMLALSLVLLGSYLIPPPWPAVAPGGAVGGLLALALAWLGGAVLVGAIGMLLRGTGQSPGQDTSWVARLTGLILCGVLLSTAIWLARGAEALIAGQIPDWGGLIVAVLLAALVTASTASAHRAIELRRRTPTRRWKGLGAVAALGAALVLLAITARVPEVTPFGQGGAGLLFGLAAALLLALAGGALADKTAALLLLGLVVPAVPALAAAGGLLQIVSAVLLLPLLGVSFLPARERSLKSGRAAGLPPIQVLASLQGRLGSFVLQLDFEEKTVNFPFGGGEQFGADPELSLSELFRLAPMRTVLDLTQRLQRGETPVDLPVRFRLRRAAAPGARQDWIGQEFHLHVLENAYPRCWLVLERQSEAADLLDSQAQIFDRLLSEAVLREERLLMLVGQDLTVPVGALRDLAQAAQEGRAWPELAPAFSLTLKVLADTLVDMRAGTGMAEGMVAFGGFSVRQMAEQLETAFAAQFAREGGELMVSLPQQADLLLRGDHGRVLVALGRVLDNALRHADASEIRLAVFVVEGQAGEVTLSWHVTDNGRGIDARLHSELFDPLSAGAARIGARPSLGLFAARKALRMIGGDIVLQRDGIGTHLVLTHPARVAPEDVLPEDAVFDGEPDAELLARRILYLAPYDSADLPIAALLRIVGRVDRATTLVEALMRVVKQPPDLIVLAPELEPMSRSEAVRSLLQSASDLPLLIAVPAGASSSAQVLSGTRVRVMEAPMAQSALRRLAKELILSEDLKPAPVFSRIG